MNRPNLSINISGRLMDFSIPKIMAIVNITPDSFYERSRSFNRERIEERINQAIEEGADIIDIGGCSTRPGAVDIGEEEELRRVDMGFEILRQVSPCFPASVDTWRSSVARHAVTRWNAAIINDVSGGQRDPEILEVAAKEKIAYVLTHSRGDSITMDALSKYDDVTAEVISELAKKVDLLHQKKINDIIIDPGFGFAKTSRQNFKLLEELSEFCRMGFPVMVGLSRKSMIWKTLGINPDTALEGTVALNAIALDRGADILRVHDVKAARMTVSLISKMKES